MIDAMNFMAHVLHPHLRMACTTGTSLGIPFFPLPKLINDAPLFFYMLSEPCIYYKISHICSIISSIKTVWCDDRERSGRNLLCLYPALFFHKALKDVKESLKGGC
jgi:hypothetical protein